MSIINQMLQDLEQRRADDQSVSPALPELRAVAAEKPKKPWLLALSAITVITLTAYLSLSPMTKQFSLRNNPMLSEAQAKNSPATTSTLIVQTSTAPNAQAPEKSSARTNDVTQNLDTDKTGLSTSLSEASIAYLSNAELQAAKPVKNNINKLIVNNTKASEIPEEKVQTAELPSPPTLVANNAPAQAAMPPLTAATTVQLVANNYQSISKKMSPAQKLLNDYKQAIQYLQMGRVAEAETLLSAILEAKPDHQDARQTLASLLLDSNRNNDAMVILKTGIEINPAQIDFRLTLARLELELSSNQQALKTIEEGASYAQNNAEYHSFYATLLQRSNKHQEAVEHYTKALASNPNMSSSLIGLGISLQTLSRLTEAQEAFERAQNNKLSPELAQFVAQRIKQIKQLLG